MSLRLRVGTDRFGGMLVAAALALLCAAPAQAQYRVFAWENFESGALSDSLDMVYHAKSNNVYVAPYTVPDAPPGIQSGIAQVECGRFALRFDATPNRRILGVINKLTLDRRGLGEHGRALYQADLWLPAEAEKGVNLAVLAVAKPEPGQEATSALWRNYRIGILDGDKIFYSYTDGNKKKGSPVDYKHVKVETLNLQRPGWHRFQLIFEGQDRIVCAVDGKPTAFSPIIEPTLQQLQAGFMVTVPEEQTRTYYADNLSIQWTSEELLLPDSPWSADAVQPNVLLPGMASPPPMQPMAPAAAPGMAAPQSPGFGQAPAPAAAAALNWYISPEQAWEQVAATGKPALIMFYAPRALTYQTLEQILQTDPLAKQLISRFVPLRVDVNQLRGGLLGQQFAIFRVPTFVVLGPDSRERVRVTFDRSATWQGVAAELQRGLTPAPAQ